MKKPQSNKVLEVFNLAKDLARRIHRMTLTEFPKLEMSFENMEPGNKELGARLFNFLGSRHRLTSGVMNRVSRIICLALFTVLLMACPVFAEAPKPAATVNGAAITEAEVDAVIERMIPSLAYHQELAREKKEMYRKDAIERLVVSRLLYQEAVRLGLTASDKDVRKTLEEMKAGFRSKDDFEKFLKEKGITENELEADIRQSMTIDKILKIKVDEPSRPEVSELKDYYEANKTRFVEPEKIRINEMFIYVDPDAGDDNRREKKEKAAAALKRVKAGEDFCKLVSEYSDDELRDKCGDTGYLHKGRFDPRLEEQIWDIKDGEVKMITLENGIIIAKFSGRQPGRQMPFDQLRPGLEKELANKKKDQISNEFVKGLREKATIKIY